MGVNFYFISAEIAGPGGRCPWPPEDHSKFTKEHSKTMCTAATRVVDFDHLEEQDDPNPTCEIRFLYGEE